MFVKIPPTKAMCFECFMVKECEHEWRIHGGSPPCICAECHEKSPHRGRRVLRGS